MKHIPRLLITTWLIWEVSQGKMWALITFLIFSSIAHEVVAWTARRAVKR